MPPSRQHIKLATAPLEEEEVKEMSDREFCVQILKLLREIEANLSQQLEDMKKSIHDFSNVVSVGKDTEEKNQQEVLQPKNSVNKVNAFECYNKRLDRLERRISKVEDRSSELIQSGKDKEETLKKCKESVQHLQDTIKQTNIRILGIPEGEEMEKGTESIFYEIIAENFPSLRKDTDIQIQEAQRTPSRHDPKRSSPRHIVITLSKVKDKERILKAARGKRQVTYKGTPVRLTADFSAETLQARREWNDVFRVLKGKNYQPRILYPARLTFRHEGEVRSFSDKQKLREFITTRPALQEALQEVLPLEAVQ